MENILKKVAGYSHKQRILRLIEIATREERGIMSAEEFVEKREIQRIREENGEIAAVKAMREKLGDDY